MTLIETFKTRPYQHFTGEVVVENKANTGTHVDYFRFNGKELDPETGNYYYGARYYDPTISIWLSVDPKANAFPSLSPYNFNMNNPIMMIDPGGDSTVYVNSDGKHLYTSHDRLENSVVIVDNEEAFKWELERHSEEDLTDPFTRDKINSNLREYGQSYDIDGIKEFYKRNLDANDWEHANYLYVKDGMIRVGTASNDFTDKSRSGIIIPYKKDAVGSIHQHEWHMLSSSSSEEDRASYYKSNPYRDVIVSSRGRITFLNSNNNKSGGEFSIPWKNIFKK